MFGLWSVRLRLPDMCCMSVRMIIMTCGEVGYTVALCMLHGKDRVVIPCSVVLLDGPVSLPRYVTVAEHS